MNDIIEQLVQAGSGPAIDAIAKKAGVSPEVAKQMMQAAGPLLTTALAKNAQKEGGAESLLRALQKDHDGSILDHVEDVATDEKVADGTKILAHVLGSQNDQIVDALAKQVGGNKESTSALLAMVAPMVMGTIGKQVKAGGIDSSSGMLGLLDLNKNGSVVDDVPKILGMLGTVAKFFGKGNKRV